MSDTVRRPYTITLKYLKETEVHRHRKLNTYARYILGVLAAWYPNEYQMLQYLAQGDIASYHEFEEEVPEYTEHLRSYELVVEDPPRLAMTFLANYLKPKRTRSASAAADDDQNSKDVIRDSALLEISQLRITFEPALRSFIKMSLMAHQGAEKWISGVLAAVPEERRIKLAGIDRDEILQNHLFLPDLLNTILKNWACFAHLEKNSGKARLTKSQIEILINHVNQNRQDAHPKPISEADMATLRVVYDALLTTLEVYRI